MKLNQCETTSRAQLKRHTKPVISNSILAKIDMRIIGDGEVGPMTKRLSELYAQRTANEGVRVVD